MKKLFVVVIILIAALILPKKIEAYAPHKTASAQLAIHATDTSEQDFRVLALEKVFKKYNSPLQGHAKSYVEIADKNGVDWKLLPAISGLESTFARHLMPNSYNAYGWGGGHIYFSSWEDGIDTITKALKKNYYDRGANTVWTIGPIYAESPTWSVRVNGFMNTIEREYIDLLMSDASITI